MKSIKTTLLKIIIILIACMIIYNFYLKENYINNDVAVMVLTTESSLLTRGLAVWNTWGNENRHIVFTCNCPNVTKIKQLKQRNEKIPESLKDFEPIADLPMLNLDVVEDYNQMGTKVYSVLERTYKIFSNIVSWYLLVDDDTYVFTENLVKFVKTQNKTSLNIYGFKWNIELQDGYIGGGAGMLYSNESMRLLAQKIEKKECENFKTNYGDISIGYCADSLGIKPVYPFDEFQKPYFHPHDPKTHFSGPLPSPLYESGSHNGKIGKDCCSLDTITFHYVQVEDMYSIHSKKDYLKELLL